VAGFYRGLREASSALALSMFVAALTARGAAADIVPDANLPSGVCISFAETDVSQCVSDQPPSPGANNELALSSTHRETITTVILPDGTGVSGSGPVQDQLNALLTGPNGTTLQNALSPVIGSSTLIFIDRQYNGTDLTIVFEDTLGPGTVLVGFNRTRSYFAPPGTVVLNIISNFDRLFTDTFQATNSLSAEGLGWLSGDLHTTFQTVLLDDGFGFTDVLLSRGRRSAGAQGYIIAAADGGEPLEANLGDGWSTWSKSSYRNASFDDTSSNYGFDSNGWSAAYGFDHADGDWLFGAAAGYSTLKSKQNTTGDKGDLEAFKAGLYASYHPGDWTISGSASGSFQSIESERLTLLPTPATADYDAISFNVGLEAARHIALSGNAFFEPMAGLNYSHLHTDAFTEAGGGGLGLSVDAENTDALKAYIGARLAGTFDMNNRMTITPELRGRVVYDVLGEGRDLTANLVDATIATPFDVSGLEPNRLGGIIGVGLTLAGSQNWQATLSYDAEIRGGDVSHTARAGFNFEF
jgi:uncharacterized protein with beta-barrel porin domain